MNETTTRRRFEVFVVLDSEHHTAGELAALVGAPADESWSKGETFTLLGKERRRTFSRWAVGERDDDVANREMTTNRLIDRLRRLQDALRSVPDEINVSLTMYITEDNDVFGFGLDKAQMQFFASIGAELNVSFVVRT
jgi:hypothetical protein